MPHHRSCLSLVSIYARSQCDLNEEESSHIPALPIRSTIGKQLNHSHLYLPRAVPLDVVTRCIHSTKR